MLFSPDECGPFRIIYMTWKVHIHIWGAFKKPQSVISCKTYSGKLEICSHLILIYRVDTIESLAKRNDDPLVFYTHLHPTVFQMVINGLY